MTIDLIINGHKKTFQAPLDIDRLLEEEGYKDKLVAVAVNGVFVPKAHYCGSILQEGDEIDVVSPMQGG